MSSPKKDTVVTKDNYVLLSGRANFYLAQKIARLLKKELYNPISIFSDGEIRVKVPENIRRRHVYIIQPTSFPVNDSLMELVFMIDAARRSSANEINVIIPYFGYSRQDRKEMPRVPISSSVVSRIISNAGADRILTVDIHSEQQQGFVEIPWDNLYGSYTLTPEISSRNLKNVVIASPDKGGMARATGYARLLKAQGVAIVYKERDIAVNNRSEALTMIGDVEGKNIVLIDDMIDTAGTICSAANLLKKRGAKKILAVATHGLFSGNALEKIVSSGIDEVIVTDTILLRDEIIQNKKIKTVSVAPLLAEAIKRIESGDSISRDLIL